MSVSAKNSILSRKIKLWRNHIKTSIWSRSQGVQVFFVFFKPDTQLELASAKKSFPFRKHFVPEKVDGAGKLTQMAYRCSTASRCIVMLAVAILNKQKMCWNGITFGTIDGIIKRGTRWLISNLNDFIAVCLCMHWIWKFHFISKKVICEASDARAYRKRK